MADAFGIQAAVQRTAPAPAAAPAAPSAPAAPAAPKGPVSAQQIATAFVAVPGTVRVAVPPRQEGEERQKPRKAAAPMANPRPQDGGLSPLASASIADTFGGVEALSGRSSEATSGDVANSHQDPGSVPGEQQADADFAAGRYKAFNTHVEFLAELGVG